MAEQRKSSGKASVARARAAEADAKARTAEAEARASEARVKAEVELKRLEGERAGKAAAEKLAADRAAAKQDPTVQWTRGLGQLAAVGGGLYIGKKLAMGIDSRFQTTVKARTTQVRAIARSVAQAKDAAGAAAAAGAAGRLTRMRAPLGLGLAGGLLAEAAVTRFVISPGLEDAPHAQALADAVATGSTLAAVASVGQQSVNRATPQAVLDGRALSAIEAAKAGHQLPSPTKATPATPPPAKRARPKLPAVADLRADAAKAGIPDVAKLNKPALLEMRKAGKFSLTPIAAIAAAAIAYDATKSQAKAAGKDDGSATGDAVKAAAVAGGSTVAIGAAVAGGVKLAAQVGGKALTRAVPIVAVAAAGYEAVQGFKKGGLAGAGTALADFATFGAFSFVKDKLASKPAGGGAYLNAAAEAKASAAPVATVASSGAPTLAMPARPDGQTAGYMRIDPRTGKTVQVKGYATPKK